MENLDQKLNRVFPGCVVRKDLLHQIKKGTNVPSFVLEFLLAKFCATDDPDEIQAGIAAVIETIQKNYVRPDESNRAQSLVQQKGKHKFIDKIHVRYVEGEKRHWAEMENFNSRRIAINESFYRDNDRLLEGGIWAEVVLAHNDVEDDDYAFLVEELRPIQLSRFDFDACVAGRKEFTRDEWMDVLLRSIGLEPSKLSTRVKFHFLGRLFGLVEANYNFIELGPRGTGKSYVFSEFSPYATLISGGQASTSVLLYNNARKRVGLIGFWDMIAFDEVGSVKIKDSNTIEILKDYMANGRFSRGATVIANASLGFVGNIDHSIEQLVNSAQFDLFEPLPEVIDLAVMDRFHTYLPGWEVPKNSSALLTSNFGFITDYLAEVFHYLNKKVNRYEYVNRSCRFGPALQGRDEVAIKKTICALIKLLHPGGEPSRAELDEYMAYAVEGRRRVKEQMNKRKADDEFAGINLSYFDATGTEIVVFCPESKDALATQNPTRRTLTETKVTAGRGPTPAAAPATRTPTKPVEAPVPAPAPATPPPAAVATPLPAVPVLKEKHLRIAYGDTGFTYESLFGDYLKGAREITVEDPYIRVPHQISNFLRFCELVVRSGSAQVINLTTSYDDEQQRKEAEEKLKMIGSSLLDHGIKLNVTISQTLHDREIRLDNGWTIQLGRGFDIYQKLDNWFSVGTSDFEMRPCLETKVDVFRRS
jgi:ATP-dependent Lon protease